MNRCLVFFALCLSAFAWSAQAQTNAPGVAASLMTATGFEIQEIDANAMAQKLDPKEVPAKVVEVLTRMVAGKKAKMTMVAACVGRSGQRNALQINSMDRLVSEQIMARDGLSVSGSAELKRRGATVKAPFKALPFGEVTYLGSCPGGKPGTVELVFLRFVLQPAE